MHEIDQIRKLDLKDYINNWYNWIDWIICFVQFWFTVKVLFLNQELYLPYTPDEDEEWDDKSIEIGYNGIIMTILMICSL